MHKAIPNKVPKIVAVRIHNKINTIILNNVITKNLNLKFSLTRFNLINIKKYLSSYLSLFKFVKDEYTTGEVSLCLTYFYNYIQFRR